MQKLTKEQAEWLIEEFRKVSCDQHLHGEYEDWLSISGKKFEKIINQCTEQEFPEFEMVLPYWGGTQKYNVTVKNWVSAHDKREVHVECGFSNDEEKEVACFSIDEFKQFTEGCLAIVKYLDEIK